MQRIDTNSHLPFCLEKKIFALCIVNPMMMIIASPWPLPSYDDYDDDDDDGDDGDDDDDDDGDDDDGDDDCNIWQDLKSITE